MTEIPLLGIPKWQIRLKSNDDGAILDYSEDRYEYTLRPVLVRTRTMIGRASYMGEGPNREIMWSIERWVNDLKHKPGWVTVMQGRSTLRRGLLPQLCALNASNLELNTIAGICFAMSVRISVWNS